MINYIWGFLIVIPSLYLLMNGKFSLLNNLILNGSTNGIKLIMDMMPLLVLWMGILEIAKDSNLLDKFGKLLKPLLIKLFPSLRNNDEAISYIASNIGANMLGLGSAATPFGLKAMSSMQKENKNKDVATEAMITFLILNTGGVTIIPTTVISLRIIYKILNPTSIIIPSIIATSISSISGLLFDYYMRKRK